LLGAEVGQPIPGEDALDGDDQILAKEFRSLSGGLGTGVEVAVQQHLPLLVEDTQVHPTGMQVDATVVSVGFGVESHQVSSLWELDTSGSIPNSYAPRGGLDEYHRAAPDGRMSLGGRG
jgi:hypothetical protein